METAEHRRKPNTPDYAWACCPDPDRAGQQACCREGSGWRGAIDEGAPVGQEVPDSLGKELRSHEYPPVVGSLEKIEPVKARWVVAGHGLPWEGSPQQAVKLARQMGPGQVERPARLTGERNLINPATAWTIR